MQSEKNKEQHNPSDTNPTTSEAVNGQNKEETLV